MVSISPRVLIRVFLRTFMVGAAFNMRGLQNVGFMYALSPGLSAIYPGRKEYIQAAGRYIRHYNCHPFWAPLMAGLFLRIEMDIAAGRMQPASFLPLKNTTMNTLSAIGDSFFGGSAQVTWALACVLCITSGMTWAAVALTAFLFALLLAFKAATFIASLRYGFSVLLWLRRWDLINWGDWIKVCNALLLLVILALFIPEQKDPRLWVAAVVCIGFGAWLSGRVHLPRSVIALAVALCLLLRIL